MKAKKIKLYLKNELPFVVMPLLFGAMPISMQLNGVVDFSEIPTSPFAANIALHIFGLFGVGGGLVFLYRAIYCVVFCCKLLLQRHETTEIDEDYAIYFSSHTQNTVTPGYKNHSMSVLLVFWLSILSIWGLIALSFILIDKFPVFSHWLFNWVFSNSGLLR